MPWHRSSVLPAGRYTLFLHKLKELIYSRMLTLMSAFVMFSLNTASSNGNVASRCGGRPGGRRARSVTC